MGKWNKSSSQAPTEQFLQNEQRRRQLIVEAAKRRREKQKKLEQLNEQLKRKQEEALKKHKEEKRQAYNKYFRPAAPVNNMHDKYEQKRKNDKIKNASNPINSQVSKWKRKGKSEQKQQFSPKNKFDKIPNTQSISMQPNLKNQKVSETTKLAQKDFQKQWGEEEQIIEDLIGSKLLDSLDLDIDTITRGNNYNKQIYQEKVQQKRQLKDAERQRESQKEIQQMKNMIGYDSMLISLDQRQKKNESLKQVRKPPIAVNMKKKQKQKNEQQAFNQLKHKKQGKLLGWTNLETVEEADDLFSNCTSQKKSNEKINDHKIQEKINSKKLLEPIPQRKEIRSNTSKQNKRNNQKIKSIEKKTDSRQLPRLKNQVLRNQCHDDSLGKNSKKNITRIRQKSQNKSIQKQKLNNTKKSLQKKPQKQQIKRPIPKTQQNFKSNNAVPQPTHSAHSIRHPPTCSVVTHQQFFDVQSFIKNDLVHLNQQQYQLQKQIRDLHLQTKDKVKQVQDKMQIRKNYKTSDNLINHHQNCNYESDVYLYSNNLPKTEDQLEESIQKLDDFLLRKQIKARQGSNLLQESSMSIIDPLSRPEDFQQQILKLAQNVSRFEEIPDPEIKGYGHMRRQKIKIAENITDEIISEGRKKDQYSQQQINLKMPRPPLLQYSGKSYINQINLEKQEKGEDKFEDSLETMGKIQVNQKLKNILFD